MASAYDEYLASQANAAIGSYGGGYGASPAPAPNYTYDPYLEYEDPYADQYAQPRQQAPPPQDQGQYQQQGPPPEQAPQQPYQDPGYTLESQPSPTQPGPSGPAPNYEQSQPPPDYVTMPGETTAYNPTTGEAWQPPAPSPNPADAWLGPRTIPERDPVMPEPEPYVPAATDPYATGDAYSTGYDAAQAWLSPEHEPPGPVPVNADPLSRAIGQGAEGTPDYSELESQQQDQQQLALLRAEREGQEEAANRGFAPPTEGQMLTAYEAPEPGPADAALGWLGDRATDLQDSAVGQFVGDTLGAVGESAPVRAAGDALGWTGDRAFEATKGLVNAVGPQVTEQGIGDVFGFVDENTPFLGGVQQGLSQIGADLQSAENFQEIIAAPFTGAIDVPLDWAQGVDGDLAKQIAAGETSGGVTGLETTFHDLPVIGQLTEGAPEWAAAADPYTKRLIVSTWDEAEAAEPGSGDLAVTRLYESYRNAPQNIWSTFTTDPITALPAGRVATTVGAATGRAAQLSTNPAIRFGGKALETGSNWGGAAIGSAENAADLGLTPLLSGAGRRLKDSPLGAPFRLTDEAQAELTVDQFRDAGSGLMAASRAEGSPPPAGGGSNPFIDPDSGIDLSRFPPETSNVQRVGDYRLITNADGESIITRADNSQIITPRPLTAEAGQEAIRQIEQGVHPIDAAAHADRITRGETPLTPPTAAGVDTLPDQPLADSRIDEPLTAEGYPDITLTSDQTGRYWLTEAETGDDLYGVFTTYDEAAAQMGNANAEAARRLIQRTTGQVNQPEIAGGGVTPPSPTATLPRAVVRDPATGLPTLPQQPVTPGASGRQAPAPAADPDLVQRNVTAPPTGQPTIPPGVGRQNLAEQAADLSRLRRTVEADPNAVAIPPGVERTPGAGTPADPDLVQRNLPPTEPGPLPQQPVAPGSAGRQATYPGMEIRQGVSTLTGQQTLSTPNGNVVASQNSDGLWEIAAPATDAQGRRVLRPQTRSNGDPIAFGTPEEAQSYLQLQAAKGLKESELIDAYDRMKTMPEDEYLSGEMSAIRARLYETGHIKPDPPVRPEIRANPDGTHTLVNGRTGSPLNPRTYNVKASYPDYATARRDLPQVQQRSSKQQEAYDRYVELQAARMQNGDPIAIETAMRTPQRGRPIPEATIQEIKQRAGATNPLPPARDGEALDLTTGQRVTQPSPTPLYDDVVRGPFPVPEFNNRNAYHVAKGSSQFLVVEKPKRGRARPGWEVHLSTPRGPQPWQKLGDFNSSGQGIAYAQRKVDDASRSAATDNPATRLGITPGTAGDAVSAGRARGSRFMGRVLSELDRKNPVRTTAGQAPTDTSRYRDLPISSTEKQLLDTPMPKTNDAETTFGDVVLRSMDEVQQAVDLARVPTLTPRMQKGLDDLAAKYNTTAEDLRAITDEAGMNRLVDAKVLDSLKREFIAKGKDPSKALQGWQETLKFLRSTTLYNKLRVPAFFNTNLFGNSVTTAITDIGALFGPGGYWDPKNFASVRRRIRKAGPERINPDDTVYGAAARNLGYQPRTSVVGTKTKDQINGLWAWNDPNKLKRGISRTLQSEEGYWMVQASDQALRESTAIGTLRQNLPVMTRDIRRHAKDTAQRMGVLVSNDQIDFAIDALETAARKAPNSGGLPAFSQTQLKQALAELPTNAGPSPATWADRVGRDWREATSKLMDDVDARVNEVAFTFRSTNVDDVLSNIFKYHYWHSRASKLYMTQAIKNPLLLAAYTRATEGLDKLAEEGNYPNSVKGFIRLWDSWGGFFGYVNPDFFVPSMLGSLENVYQEDGEYGLTKAGEVIKHIGNLGGGILEPIRMATYYSGIEGGGGMDPMPLYGLRDSLGAITNMVNASGWLGAFGLEGVTEAGLLPAPVKTISNRVAHAVSGWFVNDLGGREIGLKQVPLESDEFLRGEYRVRQIVSDLVAQQHPDATPQEQAKLIDEAMADPSGDLYQEAYQQDSNVGMVEAGLRLASPIYGRIRNVAQDERGATIGAGVITDPETGERRTADPDSSMDTMLLEDQQQDAYAIQAAVRRASPEDAALEEGIAAYEEAEKRANLGDDIFDNYQSIVKAEEGPNFRVNGREYSTADLEAMTESQRYRLAEEWLGGISAATGVTARETMETRWDERNQIATDNPQLAASLEFRQRSREYPGGPDQFIIDTASINPNYQDYLAKIEDQGLVPGTDEYRIKALSKYTGVQLGAGVATDIFNPLQHEDGIGRVAGLPEGTSLTSAWHARQAEREEEQAQWEAEDTEREAGWQEYVTETETSLIGFNEKLTERVTFLQNAGFDQASIDLYLSRVAWETEGELPYEMYDALRDEFGGDNVFVKPTKSDGSRDSGALAYWQARRQGQQVELDQFLSDRSAAYKAEQAQAAAEFNPMTDMVGVPDGPAPGLPDGGVSPFGMPVGEGGGTVIQGVMGGAPTNTDYGWRAPTSLPFYGYFEGHGGHADEHTGIDATGAYGQTLYAPVGGVVTCGGTDWGGGSWGTGCAAFAEDGGGAGRIELMLDDGTSLILGHAAESWVAPGDRVEAGMPVGTMGIANKVAHVHVERRIWNQLLSTYEIVDPELMAP